MTDSANSECECCDNYADFEVQCCDCRVLAHLCKSCLESLDQCVNIACQRYLCWNCAGETNCIACGLSVCPFCVRERPVMEHVMCTECLAAEDPGAVVSAMARMQV